jgi:maleylacetate reductase
MKPFTYDALPGRVVFGVGSVGALPDEVERLGASRVLMVYDLVVKDVAGDLMERLGPRSAGEFTDIQQHVPVEVVERARLAARDAGADCAVTVGGGSTTGFGKVIALEIGLPVVAVPTTYAGSEMTPIYGITSDGRKRTGRDPRVLPKTVIYDPALTVSLPAFVTGPSGMNAIAHCVEALYAKDANPITSIIAEEGIRALARGIPSAVREPEDLEARSDALYGAYLAGASLAAVGMAIHHRICHVLGGTFALPHGDVNAVILAHAARYNEPAAPEALARAARALGVEEAPIGLFEFARAVGAPTSLESLGMRREDLAEAARLSVSPPPWNPRPVAFEEVLDLLEDAFLGRRPASPVEAVGGR